MRTDVCFGLPGPLDLGTDAPPLPIGLDQRWMDAVDAHAVLLPQVSQAFGEGGHGGIDRAADGKVLLGLAPAGSGDRDQRAAALLEQRPGRTREAHVGEKFQRIAGFPIGVGELEKIAPFGRAGIVDENIEPAEFASYHLDQTLGCARLAQVEHVYRGLATFAADRVRNCLQRLCVAAREQEIAACIRQGQGDAASDPAAGTGHERDFTLQPKLHSPAPRACLNANAWQRRQLMALARAGMKRLRVIDPQ